MKANLTKYRLLALLLAAILLFSCSSGKKTHEIDMMPAPELYDDGTINPFTDEHRITSLPYAGMLYATDRLPSEKSGEHYANARGDVLRLGIGNIEIGNSNLTWEEARRISLLKNRAGSYPLKVTDVQELGILDRSLHIFNSPDSIPEEPDAPAATFADSINHKLDQSRIKDVFVYVHGFKVVFNNPLLVASELWHFLGYEGVFVAYAWPSTPSNLAYVSDLETAALSSHNLRVFLEYLAEETTASRIHIIGYSAGTRVVINALQQMALLHKGEGREAIRDKFRIGRVILVGSDFDPALFGAYVIDGLLQVPESISIYVSGSDKALGLSKRLFRRKRLGQAIIDGKLTPGVDRFIRNSPYVYFIDVTKAQGSSTGNGHAYFRTSPWVSSDILMTLMFDLDPSSRGLEYHPKKPMWVFPEDYILRLRQLVMDTYGTDGS